MQNNVLHRVLSARIIIKSGVRLTEIGCWINAVTVEEVTTVRTRIRHSNSTEKSDRGKAENFKNTSYTPQSKAMHLS